MSTVPKKESKWIHAALVVLALCLTGFQVLTASPAWIVSGYVQAGAHWALVATIFLLSDMQKQNRRWSRVLDSILVLL